MIKIRHNFLKEDNTSIVVAADCDLNITILFNGLFPLARFNLGKLYPSLRGQRVSTMQLSLDCSELIVKTESTVARVDLRIISSRVLSSGQTC